MAFSSKLRGVPEFEAYLKTLGRGCVKVALPALAEWIIGTPQRGLKQYPLYKYVTRKKAYGKTFQSDRQRRKVMAMISSGEILPGYPRRTGRTQRGYVQRNANNGYRVYIENKEEGAIWTRDDKRQANLNRLGGWRKNLLVIQTNIAGAIRHAQSKVNEFLVRKR